VTRAFIDCTKEEQRSVTLSLWSQGVGIFQEEDQEEHVYVYELKPGRKSNQGRPRYETDLLSTQLQ